MDKFKQGDRVYNRNGNSAIYVGRAENGGHWVELEWDRYRARRTKWPVVYSEDEQELYCALLALQQAQARYDVAVAKMKV